VVTAAFTIAPKLGTPTISPGAGTYNNNVTINFSAPAGAVVRCTTNGAVPSASSAACASLTLSQTTTVKALATQVGKSDSDVVTATFNVVKIVLSNVSITRGDTLANITTPVPLNVPVRF